MKICTTGRMTDSRRRQAPQTEKGKVVELRQVALEDKYLLESGQVFVTGIQALVRLLLLQGQADRRAGLNTAGYVTGYRGSPLGALDQQLALASDALAAGGVRFHPAVNEDLAATAVWGTQQAGLTGDGLNDGVYAMWYAKGPGVDRSGDPLRHGNLAGSSAHGGVLVLMGDDHACESSTTAHQSEYSLVNTFIPVLNPAGVQDILDFGLYGWALSRFSGCWVGLKSVHDTIEASASVSSSPDRICTIPPRDFQFPPPGVNLRWPDTPQAQEVRLHQFKLPAVAAFTQSNPLDEQVLGDSEAPLGVISTGKSYLDVRRALLELGIGAQQACSFGLKLYKVGMPWPLSQPGIRSFVRGTRKLIVVEEKRGLIEDQVRCILYGATEVPEVVGKYNETGEPLFPVYGRLDASQIAIAIGERLTDYSNDENLAGALAALGKRTRQDQVADPPMVRTPYFCAGCPHNTSTIIPVGSRALAGIGCHYMAQWMDRDTATFTQMGGEGASWIGESPFSKTDHVFQNIGDGTYFHSGLLAIRACVGARVNITYKILYNDAVAMTGGQSVDGPMDVPRVSRQVHAEGVTRIAVVTDDPGQYASNADWAPGVSVYHRDALAQVQREFREVPGTSVIIYDQTCAAEKRRRRRRGLMSIPAQRLFINQAVCEGCGDCGAQSNCVALVPVETDLGRKRAIDQSACNLDFSCQKGFCPSFVSVVGGQRRQGSGGSGISLDPQKKLPNPEIPLLRAQYSIVLTGVGGTGVVTTGAIIGMAAHLAHLGCSVLDMAGLAQKGGAVTSHIILAPTPEDISATHVADGGGDLLLGCDLVTSAAASTRKKLNPRTTCAINTHQMMSGEFIHNPDQIFPVDALLESVREAVPSGILRTLPATELAKVAFGEVIVANMIMLGYAQQLGVLPIPPDALERAIEINGQSVEMNKQALQLGRAFAFDPDGVGHELGIAPHAVRTASNERADTRVSFLTDILSQSHGSNAVAVLRGWLDRVRDQASPRVVSRLRAVVAESGFQVLYEKDEYEVARLYTRPEFREALAGEFTGSYRLKVHLAPPLFFSRLDPATGRPAKVTFGSWIFVLFHLLRRVKSLRGRWCDPFRYSAERRLTQQMQVEFEKTLERLLTIGIETENLDAALDIARWPLQVRGFGPVRQGAFDKALSELAPKWEALETPLKRQVQAA